MPAALKTPLPQHDLAPDSPVIPHAAAPSQRAAAVAVPAPARPRRDVPRSKPLARPAEGKSAAPAAAAQAARHHRHFRPTITALLCGSALMGQLVLLLWLHGKTLTAAREVEKLDVQIADVSNHIERAQERIAAFDSSPQIKHWAAQKGWRPVTHSDFDDITKPEAARAAAQAQPEGEVARND